MADGLVCRFWKSTLGKKIVMAITGAVMVLFVVGHMVGNLKAFGGFDPASGVYKLDHYAHFLRTIGADMLGEAGFLWMVRAGLFLSVVLHVLSAVSLKLQNGRAKPIGITKPSYRSSTVASRTMTVGGLLLLVFIIVHILHFTTGHLHFDGFVEGRVYSNIFAAFSKWQWVLFYALAMGALGLHLFHGTWSLFQTLGVDTPRWNGTLRLMAKAVSVVVAVGFVSVPLAIYLKFLAAPHADAPATAFAHAASAPQLFDSSSENQAR